MDFDKWTDDELAMEANRSSQNSDAAMDFLLEKYKKNVRRKARTLYLVGGDNDDLMQEGMIGLLKAVSSFNCEKEASFATYAELCISRQLYNTIKASNRKKNSPLNSYVSLYSPIDQNEEIEHHSVLADVLLAKDTLNPEDIFIDKETTSMIEYELGKRLSSYEKKVLGFYLEGLNYQEIAKELDKTPKSIDNALSRIKSKLLNIVQE